MNRVEEIVETGLEIAVIGMAGKFPGANNIHDFWNNLKAGLESIQFFNDKELEELGINPGTMDKPNFVKTNGGVLEGIEYFDAFFFDYTPMEAEQMAPQIRIFHECIWEAMEDAGYEVEHPDGFIGLYGGASSTNHWESLCALASGTTQLDPLVSKFLSNRDFINALISYKLNINGPVFFLHTACSTSLVAIHLACQGLLAGDCHMALAGGVALNLTNGVGYFYQEGMIFSKDGHCRAFDVKAQGTIGGEGAGIIVLKRLEDALTDRDHIYALIKGSAINNDGNRKVGFTAPSIQGQVEVIRRAHAMAEVDPKDIGYIETHGTGTSLGDVTEMEALKLAFNTNKKHYCGLGAVKTNVGHLDTAAGVTAIIKVILAIKHKQIPPTLHFEAPNPRIDIENSPFYLNKELKQWDNNGRLLRAGVSSFGIGGTNAHVVLEEWSKTHSAQCEAQGPGRNSEGTRGLAPLPIENPTRQYHLILLSAKTESALEKVTVNFVEHLKKNQGAPLADIAYTLQMGRKRFPYRRKLVCSDVSQAITGLNTSDSRNLHTLQGRDKEKPVTFMFPGLGAEYENMGLELYQTEPIFRQEMDRCFKILKPLMGYDIKDILYPPYRSDRSHPSYNSHKSHINQFEVAQLVTFIFEYSLARLLMAWGIQPRAMIGYSFGEYASACLSGVFTLEDALELLVIRGKLIRELPPGMMLNVPWPAKDIEPLLNDELCIGIDNGTSCVVSGSVSAINAFQGQMKQEKVMCMPLDSVQGIHSSMMDPILERFEEQIKAVFLHQPQIPFISTVTGDWIVSRHVSSPAYWARQLRETVYFSKGIRKLLEAGEPDSIFLEVGPGQELSALVNREKDDTSGHQVIHLVRPRKVKKEISAAYYLLDKIGLLWLYGVSINWREYHGGEARYRVSLPTYPFERQRFWKLVQDFQAGKFATQTRGKKQPGAAPPGELSHWFYLPTWKRQKITTTAANEKEKKTDMDSCWLVFTDDCGLGNRLTGELKKHNRQQTVVVKKGTGFEKQNNCQYTLHPAEYHHYQSLLEALKSDGLSPRRILHLWGVTANHDEPAVNPASPVTTAESIKEACNLGFYSLLYLARALGRVPFSAEKIEINVVTNHMLDVYGDESLSPGKAAVLGPCRVIPQEYPHLTCKNIDITHWESPRFIHQLLKEITTETGDRVIAFRGSRRWIQTFEPTHLEMTEAKKSPLLREQGVYLIIGGLGNIGSTLAEYLLKVAAAKVILTGRSPLPPRESWGQLMILGSEKDKVFREVQRLQHLESLGGDVLYCPADASDLRQMKQAIHQGEEQFGPINGIIHSAGIIAGEAFNSIADITEDQCQIQFQAKLRGLPVLEELVQDKNPDFCLLISSISTVLGGLGFTAYAAANHFMDAFSHRYNQKEREPWIIVDWDGTNKEDTEKAFHCILSPDPPEQTVFSVGGNLEGRISRWVKLEGLGKGQVDTGEREDIAPLYSRPELSNPYVAPRNALEQQLADIWQRFFGIDKIGVTDYLYDLGGDSLKAINIISIIHKELKVTIPINVFLDNSTIEGAAAYIASVEVKEFSLIEPVEKMEYYPLSSAQKRLYFLQEMDLNCTGYNSPNSLPLGKDVDIAKLELSFKKLILRHEGLRTSFQRVKEIPVQKIHPSDNLDFSIDYYEVDETETREIVKNYVKPFDLGQAPLLRSGLIRLPDNHFTWMVDVHHITADGTSITNLTEDLLAFYQEMALEPLPLQYKDFSHWQNQLYASGKIKAQEDYWLSLYADAGEIPCLNLPEDFRRPEAFTFAGERCGFILPADDILAFKALGTRNKATLYMNIMAALDTLFYKYTGQPDIIIGSGIVGRPRQELQRIVGMFVNTLAMRNYPAGDKTYESFLKEVVENSINAFANQDLQFEELVDKLNLERDPARNPLFDIMMVVQNFRQVGEYNSTEENPGCGEQLLAPVKDQPFINFRNTTTKFDMTFFVSETGEDVYINIEYYTAVFRKDTITRLIQHFKKVIKEVTANPALQLKNIDILSRQEKQKLLQQLNDTKRDYPRDRTISDLFAEQVEKTPRHTAIISGQEHLTYKALDRESNRLANYFYNQHRVTADQPIGVMLDRSISMISAIIGILKVGGVYVPLSPSFPEERLKTIINDAAARVLVSQKQYIKTLNRLQWECKDLDTFFCIDSRDVYSEDEAEESELMSRKLWEYVGEKSVDEITGGGWNSSFTGNPLSKKEMDEYGDNILEKLEPLLHPRMRVLEIGCASGISMYRIAPKVGLYYGTDLSSVIIEKNRQRIKKENHQNIKLRTLAAHEIDQVEEKNFDLVILNSVIQCFNGHNYLRKVIAKILSLVSHNSYIFIGDIMDQELKEDLIAELVKFRQETESSGKNYKTKTDWSEELFIARGFLEDLALDLPQIRDMEFSKKIGTIENELTKFRYDALVYIDKAGDKPKQGRQRHKVQHDLKVLSTCPDNKPGIPRGPLNLAYIIYTSGSTGIPKGVIVEHKSVVRLVKNTNFIEFKETHKLLQTGALEFDASTFEIWGALLNGLTLVLESKNNLLVPEILRKIINKNKITVMWMTSSYFNQMLDADIDIFCRLENLLVGGEALSPSHINRLKNRFPGLNVINGYGPTENTTFSTTYLITRNHEERIPIGKPIANSTAYIVDGYGNLLPEGVPGELCVGGDGVARGYLNDVQLTAEKFIKNPYTKNHRWYRTGDRVKWLPGGDIEFLSRFDNQVKIRGFRIELEEIENQLLKYPSIREAVVIDRLNSTGTKYLAAYIVSDLEIESSELRNMLSKHLPEYMIPSFTIRMEKIPLTPNGKIDRRALPEPEVTVDKNYRPPRDEIEKKLAETWSEVLGTRKEVIGIDANFFELGGHSLKATVLTAKIHKEFEVKIPLVEIFRRQTIRELSQWIKNSPRHRYSSIKAVEKKEYYPLSSAQKRLFILQQLEPGSTGYNMPHKMSLGIELDKEKFAAQFKQLIRRHESLRTSFAMIDEEPVQRIHDYHEVEFNIDYYQCEGEGESGDPERQVKEIIENFERPFDLSKAPLLRVGLIKIENKHHVLLFDLHHIITDGTSQDILEKESLSLYSGEELPILRLQYKDFSEWQNSSDQQTLIKSQESYWMDLFPDEIPVLNLPMDYMRPVMQSFAGAHVSFVLNNEETKTLKQIAREYDVTLYMSILAVFNILLAKLSGQEDIIVGTPIAARRHNDLQSIIGMFVNTLAMRNFPSGNKSFNRFLTEVKQQTLAAYENQEYQFEDLVDKISVRRDTGRNPVFDVMFNLLNQSEYKGDISSISSENVYQHLKGTSKFDLNLTAVDYEKNLCFTLEYCTKLFKPGTIDRFIGYFKRILSLLSKNTGQQLWELEIIPAEEKEQLLFTFNDSTAPYPKEKTLHRLVEEQVKKTPDNAGIVFKDMTLTYRELDEKANQLACWLQERGAVPDTIVGIMVERSIEMIIGVLGILKAGGAYLPIDPDYPEERIKYMLKDSKAKVLLAAPDLAPAFETPSSTLTCQASPTNLAYIIYTSGSTGKPKGVMVTHTPVVNLVFSQKQAFEIGQDDNILQFSSLCFDASVEQIFIALGSGSSLILVGKNTLQDKDKLENLVYRCSVTHIHAVPSYLKYIKIDYCPSLKRVISGGDTCPVELSKQWYEKCDFYNEYGPTETTVTSIQYLVKNLNKPVPGLSLPIGSPINNTWVYIYDRGMKLVPVQVVGEMYIGGAGLARGYLNNPELTSERFLPLFYRSYRSYKSYISKRIYKTGDLARWRPDGNIEFLGRIDNQVKIRGFRIELGEIETQLLKLDNIKEAVVLTMGDEYGEKHLCAYFVAKQELSASKLKEHLMKNLPDYMVPSYFSQIETIPFTASGKIDKNSLAKIHIKTGRENEYVAPKSDIEKMVADIWKDVLSLDNVGIYDSLFEIGGNSLKVIRLASRMSEVFDREIPVASIFRYTTIYAFSQYLNHREKDIRDRSAAIERGKGDRKLRHEIRKKKR
jgi:amino acid adenylation domain-containing protein